MYAVVARLDDWGKPAWIAAMVLGFVLFWPIGLVILFYMIWSGRMGCGARMGAWSENRAERWQRKMERMQEKMARWQGFRDEARAGFAPSGNRAFDEYRSEAIRRLEEEAQEFRDFLDRLRHAKDKQEFDAFMNDRRSRPAPPAPRDDGEPPAPPR
jgi:hypothetical protein